MPSSERAGLCQRGWGRGEFGSKAGGSEIPGQATQEGQEGRRAGGHRALRQSSERGYVSLSSVWAMVPTRPLSVYQGGGSGGGDSWVPWPVQHPVVVPRGLCCGRVH